MNSEVLKFQVKGAISVWKYIDGNTNYKGWHIYICPEARKSMMKLLKLMSDDNGAARKAIYLSPPTEEIIGSPNNYRGLASYRYKRILFLNSKKNLDTFSINENGMIVEIILDDSTFSKFKRQIVVQFKGQRNLLSKNKEKDLLITFW